MRKARRVVRANWLPTFSKRSEMPWQRHIPCQNLARRDCKAHSLGRKYRGAHELGVLVGLEGSEKVGNKGSDERRPRE
eukprot:2973038-Rhodomonas_salina.2